MSHCAIAILPPLDSFTPTTKIEIVSNTGRSWDVRGGYSVTGRSVSALATLFQQPFEVLFENVSPYSRSLVTTSPVSAWVSLEDREVTVPASKTILKRMATAPPASITTVLKIQRSISTPSRVEGGGGGATKYISACISIGQSPFRRSQITYHHNLCVVYDGRGAPKIVCLRKVSWGPLSIC